MKIWPVINRGGTSDVNNGLAMGLVGAPRPLCVSSLVWARVFSLPFAWVIVVLFVAKGGYSTQGSPGAVQALAVPLYVN